MTGTTPNVAIQAVFANNLDTLKNLSDDLLEQKDPKGRTCVHAASFVGNVDILKYLIEQRHCNANAVDFNELTAVHYACGHPWDESSDSTIASLVSEVGEGSDAIVVTEEVIDLTYDVNATGFTAQPIQKPSED